MTTTTTLAARDGGDALELAQMAQRAAYRINLRRYRGAPDVRQAVNRLRTAADAVISELAELEQRMAS